MLHWTTLDSSVSCYSTYLTFDGLGVVEARTGSYEWTYVQILDFCRLQIVGRRIPILVQSLRVGSTCTTRPVFWVGLGLLRHIQRVRRVV